MRNKSTSIVLAALLCIFGYFSWEHFSEKKYSESKNEREYEGERR